MCDAMSDIKQDVTMETIETNFKSINIPHDVQLLVASKSQSSERILYLYNRFNQKIFGENYVQELVVKANALPPDIEWHFIGRIQSNKIHSLLKIPNLNVIETVDGEEHVNVIERECEKLKRGINVFIQINVSDEERKGGIKQADLFPLVDLIESKRNVRLEGLMTIGSSQEHEFLAMNEMRKQVEERLQRRIQLSMGMSNDWEVAVSCGASQVRIGRLIFGSGSVEKEHDVL